MPVAHWTMPTTTMYTSIWIVLGWHCEKNDEYNERSPLQDALLQAHTSIHLDILKGRPSRT